MNSVPTPDSDKTTKAEEQARGVEDGRTDTLTTTDKELQNSSRSTETELVERAAIIEFDGGVDRDEAERLTQLI